MLVIWEEGTATEKMLPYAFDPIYNARHESPNAAHTSGPAGQRCSTPQLQLRMGACSPTTTSSRNGENWLARESVSSARGSNVLVLPG